MSGAGAQPAHRAEQEDGQQVGGAARHRDDERTERLRPVEASHAGEEAEEPPGLGARLGRDRGHGQVGRRGRLLRQEAQEHRGAVGVVALREARVDAERIEHAAERGGEAARVLADVQARGVQPEGRRLDAHRVQVIGGDLARDRSRDHVEHLLDGLDRDARLVRRLVEQPGRHVLLRRRLEVGREQRQREAIGLAAVAPLEIGHVRRQGTARVEPGGERGRRRTATAAHAEAPGEIVERPAMPLDGEPPVQAQRLGGHRRHHRRIAVAVAADPRGQREPPGRRAPGPGSARPPRPRARGRSAAARPRRPPRRSRARCAPRR